MAPMPTAKIAPTSSTTNGGYLYTNASDSALESGGSSPTPSSPPSSTADVAKSHCSSLSDGESFEGYGENDLSGNISSARHRSHGHETNVDNDGNNNLKSSASIELDLVPQGNTSSPNNEENTNCITRDSWDRRSRRGPTSNGENFTRRWGSMRQSGRRQLGSNAFASQLYRSSSFNSSGRSSNCDTTEDMYSDVSLDNNPAEISYRLELIQRQVTEIADTKIIAEDQTIRAKTENAVLQARYHMLEEQYREAELRAEERLAEEQKRYKELLARVEREAELQNENCQFRIKTIELEANSLREETQRLKALCDKHANDLHNTQEDLELARDQISVLQQDLDEAKRKERLYEQEKKSTEELMLELSKELERLRAETGPAMPTTSPEAIRLEELHQELEEIRKKNRVLEEQNEDLQAQVLTRGVEEGRQLLNGTLNSLAQELEEMSQAQDSVDSSTLASLSQLQQAYQEKEEENARLKKYIDTIILNIVENYPQLLEIKSCDN